MWTATVISTNIIDNPNEKFISVDISFVDGERKIDERITSPIAQSADWVKTYCVDRIKRLVLDDERLAMLEEFKQTLPPPGTVLDVSVEVQAKIEAEKVAEAEAVALQQAQAITEPTPEPVMADTPIQG